MCVEILICWGGKDLKRILLRYGRFDCETTLALLFPIVSVSVLKFCEN